MAKSGDQKLKLFYLVNIFSDYTDGEHSLTMQEIIEKLAECGIKAERKSIYSDISELHKYGIEIIGQQKNRTYYYHIENRLFSNEELSLIINAVLESDAVSEDRSKEIIEKLKSFASIYDGDKLLKDF
ncbi:MAG: hypothetical protein VZR00_02010 [Lachnospiraceae bacterium]|jgi:predicted DNA-binding transcriptional regulator YafY|nr:hypothetical protein [Lachnospiraceae bacterium]MEE3460650.1 hypothetical protein [Lachnospiraceae bacterium]